MTRARPRARGLIVLLGLLGALTALGQVGCRRLLEGPAAEPAPVELEWPDAGVAQPPDSPDQPDQPDQAGGRQT